MARWLHALQQFQFSLVHRLGRDHGNIDGLSRVPSSPCRQCTRPECPPAVEITVFVYHMLLYLYLQCIFLGHAQEDGLLAMCMYHSTTVI